MKRSINKYLNAFLILALALMFLACEDTINPDLEDAESVLVVDAWINNKPETQKVKLTKSQPYFEDEVPPGVSNATVYITDSDGKVYNFTENKDTKDGSYEWKPASGEVFGEVGKDYTLTVITGGETFTASAYMGRVPEIEKIEFNFEEGNQFLDDAYLGEFFATDLEGEGDTYWIKAYKNGVLLNRPSEINVAYDAGFTAGSNFDGSEFLPPIRTAVNPQGDEDENGDDIIGYDFGDSLYVEIHSVTNAAFDYLNEVIEQTDRPGGFSELFSTPLANVSTNIANTNPKGSKAVGFFNVSATSGLGKKMKEE